MGREGEAQGGGEDGDIDEGREGAERRGGRR